MIMCGEVTMGIYYATWQYAEDDKEPEKIEIKEVKVKQVHEWAVEYNGKGVTEGMITIEAPDIINAAILAKAQLFGLNIRKISIVEEGDEDENA